MADEHKVYINSESYYFGHKRLPSDLPLETTGTGSLESPRVPVQGGSVDGLTDAGALDGTEEVPLAGGVKTTTQDIADLGGGGALGYLVYNALLTQTGTDAPVATVLGSNTIGNIVWTRFSQGAYHATLIGAFPLAKTFILVGSENFGNGGEGFNNCSVETDDSILLDTLDNDNPPNWVDERLYKTTIQIRVYP